MKGPETNPGRTKNIKYVESHAGNPQGGVYLSLQNQLCISYILKLYITIRHLDVKSKQLVHTKYQYTGNIYKVSQKT